MSQLSVLRGYARLRRRDTDTANMRYANADYLGWFNRGLQRLARETLILKATGTANASAAAFSSYALTGLTSYYMLKGVDVDNSLYTGFVAPKYSTPALVDIEEIRRISQLVYAGTLPSNVVPTKFAVWGNTIYFNAFIPKLDGTHYGVVNFRYVKLPTALVNDIDSPDAPFNNFDSLVLAAAEIEFGYDSPKETSIEQAFSVLEKELDRFRLVYPNEVLGSYSQEPPI